VSRQSGKKDNSEEASHRVDKIFGGFFYIVLGLGVFWEIPQHPTFSIQVELDESRIMRIRDRDVPFPLLDDGRHRFQSAGFVTDDDHLIIKEIEARELVVRVIREILVMKVLETWGGDRVDC
jgi:hypothetical protein